MKRSWLSFLAFLLAGAGMLQADQTTSAVQQALKDQGFYYGDVTGEKTADTTAAIRRYQIRNGLQITGEIDAETLRSLGVGSGVARSTAQAQPTAAPEEESSDGGTPTQSAQISPQPPPANYPSQRVPGEPDGPGSSQARPVMSDVFAGTPYEIAPPDLQRHVIVGAQTLLARLRLLLERNRWRVRARHAFSSAPVPSPRGSPAGRPPQHGNVGCPWFAPGSARTRIPRATAPAASTADLPRRVGALSLSAWLPAIASCRESARIAARRKPCRQKCSPEPAAKAGRNRRKPKCWRVGISCAVRVHVSCRSC